MNKAILALSFSLVLLSTVKSQNDKTFFGIKAGINYSKYLSSDDASDFSYVVGFYAGGSLNFKLNDKLNFQPEVLFSLNRIKNEQEVAITDTAGNPLPFTSPYDFEYKTNEYRIDLPLMIQLFVSEKFFFESGPQLGFIVDKTISSSEQLLDGTGEGIFNDEFDTFDFGIALGVGYNISSQFGLNIRSYSSLLERDNNIKSFVLNLGGHYNF